MHVCMQTEDMDRCATLAPILVSQVFLSSSLSCSSTLRARCRANSSIDCSCLTSRLEKGPSGSDAEGMISLEISRTSGLTGCRALQAYQTVTSPCPRPFVPLSILQILHLQTVKLEAQSRASIRKQHNCKAAVNSSHLF